MVTRDGIFEGFVCVGMPCTAAELILLFERSGELPADRSVLLRYDGPDYEPSAGSTCAPVFIVAQHRNLTAGRKAEIYPVM